MAQVPIPVAVNDVLAVQIGCYFAGQASINTVHYKVTAVTGTPLTLDVAEDIDAAIHGFFKSVMTNTASYYGVRVQRVFPLPRSVAVFTADNVGVGTAGTNALPSQVAGLISWQTGIGSHSDRGRIYIPFPDESNSDPDPVNRPDGGYTNTLESIANELGTDWVITAGGSTADLSPVIYHREDGTTTDIEGWVIRDVWATQRRRGSLGQGNKYPPF